MYQLHANQHTNNAVIRSMSSARLGVGYLCSSLLREQQDRDMPDKRTNKLSNKEKDKGGNDHL